ncbi:MAG: tetratricopeptide repeat protein, partial [Desulfobulbaceae bacterium]|nr:tetratricopeptide repeat protein [Desulfobulbaceae bacterium]
MKKKIKGRYTKKFKSHAIKLVVKDGMSIPLAAKQLSMPKSTLSRWVEKTKIAKVSINDSLDQDASETEQIRRELALLKEDRDRLQNALIASEELFVVKTQGEIATQTGEIMPVQAYDETMLDRAREQWRCGDWNQLVEMEPDSIQHHPERAKLAMLSAVGHQQNNDLPKARQFVRLAQEWGCDKKLVARILIAGVHNSLGRASVVTGQEQRAIKHFESAISISMPGSGVRVITQARIQQQKELLQSLFPVFKVVDTKAEFQELTEKYKFTQVQLSQVQNERDTAQSQLQVIRQELQATTDLPIEKLGDEAIDIAEHHNKVGEIYFRNEHFGKAEAYFRKAIAIKQNSAWYYQNLGEAVVRLGRWEEAVRLYRHALKLNPEKVQAHHQALAVKAEDSSQILITIPSPKL